MDNPTNNPDGRVLEMIHPVLDSKSLHPQESNQKLLGISWEIDTKMGPFPVLTLQDFAHQRLILATMSRIIQVMGHGRFLYPYASCIWYHMVYLPTRDWFLGFLCWYCNTFSIWDRTIMAGKPGYSNDLRNTHMPYPSHAFLLGTER